MSTAMAKIEPDAKSGTIRVVDCDDDWVSGVGRLTGRERRRTVLPTIRGYLALRLARSRSITVGIVADDGDEDRLRATLEAVRKLPWDPGMQEELARAVSDWKPSKVDVREIESLCDLIWRDVAGPIRAGMNGKDLGPGPKGSRDEALA